MFSVLNEKLNFKNGDVIAVFKIDDSDKTYIMYSLDDYEKDESKILISYLKKNDNGYDSIESISSIEERKKIINLLKELLNGGVNNNGK